MKFSIIVPTVDKPGLILSLLESLGLYAPEDCEIIFVCQPPHGRSTGILKCAPGTCAPNLKIITTDKNIGWTGAINCGFKGAKGEYLIMLNDDTIITPRLFEKLSAAITWYPHAGLAGPYSNFVMPLQRIDPQYNVSKKNIKEIADFSDLVEKQFGREVRETSVISGVCMMVKRECYEALIKKDGFFLDDRFFCGWDDPDVCLRARELGYKAVIAQGAYLHHDGNATTPGAESWGKHPIFIDKWAARRKDNPKLVAAFWTMPDETHLAESLKAAGEIADEIVIVMDERPTRNKGYGDMLYLFKFSDDFPKVVAVESINPSEPFNEKNHRNQLMRLALSRNPDWIVVLDGDEVAQINRRDILRLMRNPNPLIKAYQYNYENMWMDGWTRMDDAFGRQAGPRLFKVEPNQGSLVGGTKNTGQHCPPIPPIPPETVAPSYFSGLHYGYYCEELRQKKYDWYIKTDIDKDPMLINGRRGAPGTGDYRHIIAKNIALRKWEGVQRLSLCVIAKNEGGVLDQFFSPIFPCVHEIIAVNNDSTDNTRERLELWADKVLDSHADAFDDLRNLAAGEASGNWLLFLDVDEAILAGGQHDQWNKIHRMIHNPDVDAYALPFNNIMPDGKGYYQPPNIRLYRRGKGTWRRPVHEYVDMEPGTRTVVADDIVIDHSGYIKSEKIKLEKRKQYKKLMGKYLHAHSQDAHMNFYYAIELLGENDIAGAMQHLEISAKGGFFGAHKALGNIHMERALEYWQKFLDTMPAGVEKQAMTEQLTRIAQTIGPTLMG